MNDFNISNDAIQKKEIKSLIDDVFNYFRLRNVDSDTLKFISGNIHSLNNIKNNLLKFIDNHWEEFDIPDTQGGEQCD